MEAEESKSGGRSLFQLTEQQKVLFEQKNTQVRIRRQQQRKLALEAESKKLNENLLKDGTKLQDLKQEIKDLERNENKEEEKKENVMNKKSKFSIDIIINLIDKSKTIPQDNILRNENKMETEGQINDGNL